MTDETEKLTFSSNYLSNAVIIKKILVSCRFSSRLHQERVKTERVYIFGSIFLSLCIKPPARYFVHDITMLYIPPRMFHVSSSKHAFCRCTLENRASLHNLRRNVISISYDNFEPFILLSLLLKHAPFKYDRFRDILLSRAR